MTGHDHGDYWLMKAFVDSVRLQDASLIQCSAAAALEAHLLVFAAERSRKENAVLNPSGDHIEW